MHQDGSQNCNTKIMQHSTLQHLIWTDPYASSKPSSPLCPPFFNGGDLLARYMSVPKKQTGWLTAYTTGQHWTTEKTTTSRWNMISIMHLLSQTQEEGEKVKLLRSQNDEWISRPFFPWGPGSWHAQTCRERSLLGIHKSAAADA